MNKPKLTEQDFKRAAKSLRCEVATIKAVADVESRGEGFYADGFPVLLFERHKFYKYCDSAHRAEWSKKYPSICNPKAGGYGKAGQNQRDKFNLAFSLDPIAAMKACSWGKFQIMGFNYEICGFSSVGAFVDAMKESEGRQLEAFVEFVKSVGLADELRNHQWKAFARGYNGADFEKNHYHTKLAQAFDRYTIFKSSSQLGKTDAVATVNSNSPQVPIEQPEAETPTAENPPIDMTEGDRPPQPELVAPSAIAVPQAEPAKDETILEKAEKGVTWLSGKLMAIPAAIISFIGGIVAWVQNAPPALIYGFFGASAVIISVYLSWFMYLKNQREARDAQKLSEETRLKLQREAQAHELTKIQMESAMRKDLNTVMVVPKSIQNSDSTQ